MLRTENSIYLKTIKRELNNFYYIAQLVRAPRLQLVNFEGHILLYGQENLKGLESV